MIPWTFQKSNSFLKMTLKQMLNSYEPWQEISNNQQSLRSACAYAQSDQSLCKSLEYSMSVKLLAEHHLDFLSLKGGCTGSSKSTLVKIPHRWKSHVAAQLFLSCYKHSLVKNTSLKIVRLKIHVAGQTNSSQKHPSAVRAMKCVRRPWMELDIVRLLKGQT